MALFRTLPTPINYLLPSLMVEVCLVLAPVVNLFLNSRKQGLPCWRSLSFFLSFFLRSSNVVEVKSAYVSKVSPTSTTCDSLIRNCSAYLLLE